MSETPNTYLHLFRHGESDINTKKGAFGGRQNESPLTDKGFEQARSLGKFIQEREIVPTSVYSSPAERAHQTGYHALDAAGISIPIIPAPELQELDRGVWTGRMRQDIENDPAIVAAMNQLGMAYKPEGDESMDDAFQRVVGWANSIIDPSYTPEDPQRVFAFAHSNIIGCMVAAASGIERHYIDAIPIGYASMSVFSHANGEWQPDAVNINTQG